VKITVAQSLPKTSEKLEWVLQHGVEAGASRFWMFRSKHSEAGKLAEREDRWARIVKTAAEQSGRAKLPEAKSMGTFHNILSELEQFDLALLSDENPNCAPLKSVINVAQFKNILLLVGPEGGWSDDERSDAMGSGIKPISLGKRTLRTETAALVAISQVLYSLDAG
jgi:16S rRNA (uracil1498-N3)-methyltransferase